MCNENNINVEELQNIKHLYLKLTELYKELDTVRWYRTCNEDIKFCDERVVITDKNICDNIYTIAMNNLTKQIDRYEQELFAIKNVAESFDFNATLSD